MNLEERSNAISLALKEWFKKTGRTETTPNEIMPYLIDKGIFIDDGRSDAFKLRTDLRKLENKKQLNLIESACYVQKKINKQWYFKACK